MFLLKKRKKKKKRGLLEVFLTGQAHPRVFVFDHKLTKSDPRMRVNSKKKPAPSQINEFDDQMVIMRESKSEYPNQLISHACGPHLFLRVNLQYYPLQFLPTRPKFF